MKISNEQISKVCAIVNGIAEKSIGTPLWIEVLDGDFVLSGDIDAETIVKICEAIKPESQKKYKYEEVSKSERELAAEFSKGDLYMEGASHLASSEPYVLIPDLYNLAMLFVNGRIYRKVEIDPIEELAKEFHAIDVASSVCSDEFSVGMTYMDMAKLAIERGAK